MTEIKTIMGQEAQSGLRYFAGVLQIAGLELISVSDYPDNRRASSVTVGTSKDTVSFFLTWDVLSDLPNMPEYRDAAKEFAAAVSGRMACGHSALFYCSSGVPIRIEIEWPIQTIPQAAAAYVRAEVWDLRRPEHVAYCSVVITHQEETLDLRRNPFKRYQLIVNSLRRAVDDAVITFYKANQHPDTLQEVRLRIFDRAVEPVPSEQIQSYVAGKVFWLGFRNGGRKARVWVPDPWDATYLRVSPEELARAAEILDAKDQVILDDSGAFATAGKQLITNSEAFEHGAEKPSASPGPTSKPNFKWDLFVSHASEDKESFVRELAEALRKRGLKVWYDELTLKLGDSLRRSIDQGLAQSRFGIVVLSHAFFNKDWPQKELDGLAALEMNGRKVILPIWHNITKEEVAQYSPTLADRLAVRTGSGMPNVVDSIIDAIST